MLVYWRLGCVYTHTKGGREGGRGEGKAVEEEKAVKAHRNLGELAIGSGLGLRSLPLRVCFWRSTVGSRKEV